MESSSSPPPSPSHLLPDLRHVTSQQNGQVTLELTGFDDGVVALTLVRLTEQNVVPHSGVLNPRLLADVRHSALE